MTDKVATESGNHLPIMVKHPGMGNEYSGDNSLLRLEMPDFKFTSMDEGMLKLYQWYKERKNSLSMDRITKES